VPPRKPKAAAFGLITPGDLLTTSSTPAHAMKVFGGTKSASPFSAKPSPA